MRPPEASLIHVCHVVSRSGRASAEIARVDLDADMREAVDAMAEVASRAHSPLNDAGRHADLAHALFAALVKVEAIPGQPASAEATLEDGRTARITRIIDTV